MPPIKILNSRYSDKDVLVSLLIYALLEAEAAFGRAPTKEEILDQLFTNARADPEALTLTRRIDRLLDSLLADWDEMDEWDNS